MAKLQDMIEDVKFHAQLWYDTDGWDYVVECWSDVMIAEEIKRCRTSKGAIRKIRAAVKPLDDYRKEISSTNW